VLSILKSPELRWNRLYQYAPGIAAKLSGRVPYQLSQQQEYELIKRFPAVEEAWGKLSFQEGGTANIGRYSYILVKLCELLGYKDVLQHKVFMPLKGKKNAKRLDTAWKSVCESTGMPFIRSVL